MKSVLIIFLIALLLGVAGFIWVNIEIDRMVEQSHNSSFEWGDVLPAKGRVNNVEPVSEGFSQILASEPIDKEQGITEPYMVQPAEGWRYYQPTYNSQAN